MDQKEVESQELKEGRREVMKVGEENTGNAKKSWRQKKKGEEEKIKETMKRKEMDASPLFTLQIGDQFHQLQETALI